MQQVMNNELNRSPVVSTPRMVPNTYAIIGTRPKSRKEPNVTKPTTEGSGQESLLGMTLKDEPIFA
jgi:hypothetical protein